MGAFVGGIDLATDKATTVRYSVPDKFSNDLGSAQTWVAEKLLNQKTVVKVKGLGNVTIDRNAMNEAVSSVKTKDRALMFLALNSTLRKGAVATAESSPNNANHASIIAPVYLNGNVHMAEVKVVKVTDGQYIVNGITLDGETIYDASTYAKPAQETAANSEATAKLVGDNEQDNGGFDYQDVAKISQGSEVVIEEIGEAEQKSTAENDSAEQLTENDSDVIDLSDDNELSKLISESKESKYMVIRNYILRMFGNTGITFGDGRKAIVDGRDADHIAYKARGAKIAEIPQLRDIFKKAKLIKDDFRVEHKKFTHFAYYETYARKNNLMPRDYVISPQGKGGVEKQINSFENWMYANRDKFAMKNRKDDMRDGKKPRSENITWHGLRHARAQIQYAKYKDEGRKDPKRMTSETLGHHRPDITNVYLAELPQRKKNK